MATIKYYKNTLDNGLYIVDWAQRKYKYKQAYQQEFGCWLNDINNNYTEDNIAKELKGAIVEITEEEVFLYML